jgi:hypothetical protein
MPSERIVEFLPQMPNLHRVRPGPLVSSNAEVRLATPDRRYLDGVHDTEERKQSSVRIE